MKKLITTVFLIVCTLTLTNAQTVEEIGNFEKLIMKAYHEDQENRAIVEKLLQDKATSQDSIKKYAIELKKSDMLNQKIVLPILDKYLAKEIELTDSSLNAAYYIVQHAGKADQEKYSIFVENLYNKKVIDKTEYTRFIDRVLVKNQKAQIYLKQAYMDVDVKDVYPFPLKANAKEIAKKNNLLDELEKEIEVRIKTSSKEYAPVFIEENEFVVFGHVKSKKDGSNVPIANIEVSYDGKVLAKSNKNGFYSFKISKSSTLDDVVFRDAKNDSIKKIDKNKTKDWQMVDVQF